MKARRRIPMLVLPPMVILAAIIAWTDRSTTLNPVGHVITLGSYPTSIAVDEHTGRAFISDGVDGTVSVLDTATGTPVKTISVPAGPSLPVVDGLHGRVYVASSGMQTVVQGKFVIYAQAGQAGVTALDATTGNVLWSARTSARTQDLAVDERRDRVIVSDLTSGKGRPFNPQGGISLLDGATGRLVRRTALGIGPPHILAIDAASGQIFVDAFGTGFGIVDEANGQSMRPFSLPSLSDAGQAAVDAKRGRLIIMGGTDSYLNVIDMRSWNLVTATNDIGTHPVALAVDERTGHALAVDGGLPGHVGLFDVRSGRLLRVTAVGNDPRAIAIDERTGRAFVVNHMSDTISVLDTRGGKLLRTVPTGHGLVAIAVDARRGHAFVVSTDGGRSTVADNWGWLPTSLRTRLPFVPPPPPVTHTPHGSVTIIDEAR